MGGTAEASSQAMTSTSSVPRTEPVEPGDILALSHHDTEMEVVGTRQISQAVAGNKWPGSATTHKACLILRRYGLVPSPREPSL